MSNVVNTSNVNEQYDLRRWLTSPLMVNTVIGRSHLVDGEIVGALLIKSHLSHLSMINSRMVGVRFVDVSLTACDFAGALFQYCFFKGVDFSNATFRGVTFEACQFENCRFTFSEAVAQQGTLNLTGCYLSGCSFVALEVALEGLVDFSQCVIDGDSAIPIPSESKDNLILNARETASPVRASEILKQEESPEQRIELAQAPGLKSMSRFDKLDL